MDLLPKRSVITAAILGRSVPPDAALASRFAGRESAGEVCLGRYFTGYYSLHGSQQNVKSVNISPPTTTNMSLRLFPRQQLWFVTFRRKSIRFSDLSHRGNGDLGAIVYSWVAVICSLAKRLFCLLSRQPRISVQSFSTTLTASSESGCYDGSTWPHNVHANPLITARTNVCQKTTSRTGTWRIQWHTWIRARTRPLSNKHRGGKH